VKIIKFTVLGNKEKQIAIGKLCLDYDLIGLKMKLKIH